MADQRTGGAWVTVPLSEYEPEAAEEVFVHGSEIEALRMAAASVTRMDSDGRGGRVALFVPYGTSVGKAREQARR